MSLIAAQREEAKRVNTCPFDDTKECAYYHGKMCSKRRMIDAKERAGVPKAKGECFKKRKKGQFVPRDPTEVDRP